VVPKPGTTRILMVGGSTTFGFPERPQGETPVIPGRYGVVGALQRAFDQDRPEAFELINLGVNGGSSEDTLRILRRAAHWGVSALVIYDGHNEFMGVPQTFRTTLWRFALYRRVAGLRPRVMESPGSVGFAAYGHPAHATEVVRQFGRNLDAIVSIAETQAIPVVLATQASNLSAFQPSWSTEGNVEGASTLSLAELEWRTAESPDSADLAFALGQAQFAAGQPATPAFQRARDLDAMPFRASSAINDKIREVAAAHGATLVDVDAWVTAQTASGEAEFYDWVHPRPTTAAAIAALLLNGLAEAGGWTDSSTPPSARALLPSEEAEVNRREAVVWMQWAMVRHHDPFARLRSTVAYAERARALDPEDQTSMSISGIATDLLNDRPPRWPSNAETAKRVAAIHPRLAAMAAAPP
jgi:lysophospholipase L1-like esterase